jgi:hypothetical protein
MRDKITPETFPSLWGVHPTGGQDQRLAVGAGTSGVSNDDPPKALQAQQHLSLQIWVPG